MGLKSILPRLYWIAGTTTPKDYSPLDIILRQGEILVLTGQWDKAESLYLRGLDDSQRMNSVRGQAECCFRLGDIQRLKGNHRESLENLKLAAELFQSNDDPASRAMVIGSMGGVYGEQGDYQKAIECLMERKSWAESTNNKMELETSWGNLGVMYAEQKMLDNALECYREQKSLAEELGDLVGLSYAVGNTGNIHIYRGDYGKAVDCFMEQIEMAARIGDKRALCVATCNLGLLYKRQAKLEQSLEYLQQAVKAALEIGYSRVVSVATGNEGVVYLQLGQWDQARHHLEKHKKLTEELDDRPGQVIALVNLSKLEELAETPGKVQTLLHSALDIAGKSKLTNMMVIILNMLGVHLLEQKSLDQAAAVIREAASLNREQEDPEQTAVSGLLSLVLSLEQGNASAFRGLEELAVSEASESIKLEAWMTLFRHAGKSEYLQKAENLSDKLYRQTRDIEFRIKMEKLKARKC